MENFYFSSRRDFDQTSSFRSIRQNLSFGILSSSTHSLVCHVIAIVYFFTYILERQKGTDYRIGSLCDPCELKHMDRFARKIKNAGS